MERVRRVRSGGEVPRRMADGESCETLHRPVTYRVREGAAGFFIVPEQISLGRDTA
jgi:hypothetical protein